MVSALASAASILGLNLNPAALLQLLSPTFTSTCDLSDIITQFAYPVLKLVIRRLTS